MRNSTKPRRVPQITAERLERFVSQKCFTKKLSSGKTAKVSTFDKDSDFGKYLESRKLLRLSDEEILYTENKAFRIKWLGSWEADFRQFELNSRWQVQEVLLCD